MLIVAALLLTACETTRVNNDKGVTRPTYCYPIDRC
jgi:hypothetical protein